MKKYSLIFLIFLMLVACNKKDNDSSDKPQYTYTIVADDVDMSSYPGVNSTLHNFKSVTVSEFFNTIDNKSSGIFYLGRSNCGCCKTVTKYVNEVAQELGVTIYYIDVYNEKQPLTDRELQDKLKLYMHDILNEDDKGEKAIYTPHLFTVINGELSKNLICYDDVDFTDPPSAKQENNLKNIYREIMEPFVTH